MGNFVEGFMSCIYGKLSREEILLIKKELSIYVQNFEINNKVTEVVINNDYFPVFYKQYFVSKKLTGLRDKSLGLYKLYLDDFFCSMNKDIKEITKDDILVYLFQVQKTRKISNRTLNTRRTVINGFFEWAVNNSYLQSNPCKCIEPIKYKKNERVPLTEFELKKVRKACKSIREKALIEFLYTTGCRVTELENMDISDVNFDANEVNIRDGKGGKDRKAYLTENAKLLLLEYIESRNDEDAALFVFIGKNVKRLRKPGIEYLVKEIGKRAELTRTMFPHLFRNTLATIMLKKGGDITSIQRILGHSNIQTTLIYAKQDDRKVKKDYLKCIS